MTDQHLSVGDLAARLRKHRDAARNVALELVHRSWCGDACHDQVLANLSRVVAHLEAAAAKLAGAEAPPLRVLRPGIAGLLALVATLIVALLVVPVPARPVAVSALVTTAMVAFVVATEVARAAFRRRALSAQPPPLLAGGADDQAVPDALANELRQLRIGISELLPDGEPPPGDRRAYALEQIRAARDWLDMAAHSVAGPPGGSAQA